MGTGAKFVTVEENHYRYGLYRNGENYSNILCWIGIRDVHVNLSTVCALTVP